MLDRNVIVVWEDSIFNVGPENEEFNTVSFVRGLHQNNPDQGWTVCVGPYLKLESMKPLFYRILIPIIHIFGIS